MPVTTQIAPKNKVVRKGGTFSSTPTSTAPAASTTTVAAKPKATDLRKGGTLTPQTTTLPSVKTTAPQPANAVDWAKDMNQKAIAMKQQATAPSQVMVGPGGVVWDTDKRGEWTGGKTTQQAPVPVQNIQQEFGSLDPRTVTEQTMANLGAYDVKTPMSTPEELVGAGGVVFDTDKRGEWEDSISYQDKPGFENIGRSDVVKQEQQIDPLTQQMKLKMEQDNIRNKEQTRRLTHERAVRAGYMPGTPEYEQMMRQGLTQASEQNIMATNQYNQFAAQRKDEITNNQMKEAQNYIGQIPSDVGRSAFQGLIAEGMDPKQAFAQIMQEGKLTGEGKYLDQTEVARRVAAATEEVASMTTNPDNIPGQPPLPWGPDEQAAYRDKVISSITRQKLAPLEDRDKVREEEKLEEVRLQKYIDDDDFTDMLDGDYASMSKTQKKEVKDQSKSYERNTPKTPWKEDQSISRSAAKSSYLSQHGYSLDEIVEKDGELFMITDLAKTTKDKKEFEGMSGVQTRVEYSLMAKPINGGKEVELHTSKEFDPD